MMKASAFLCLFLCLFSTRVVCAQTPITAADDEAWAAFVEAYVETMGGADEAEDADEEQLHDLFSIYVNKLNLNDLSDDELRQLPFLTETQILEILTYARSHRPILSTGELMYLTSLDYYTRRTLQLFCYAGPLPSSATTLRQLLHDARHDFVLRTDIPLQSRMGYADYPPEVLAKSPNKVYLGTPLYHSLRYAVSSSDLLQAGVQLEKDAGESGVDYLAAHAMLRNVGRFSKIIVGDYRVSFGQGLVVNSTTYYGKTLMLNGMGRHGRGLRPHSSMAEDGFFRGAGATVRLLSALHATFYGSVRHVDGTMLADSSGVSSLKTDGLHRTHLERSKDGNVQRTDFGGNVEWQHQRLTLSLSAAYTHFDTPLKPRYDTPASRYRIYNARGTDFANGGIAYTWRLRGVVFTGETAVDRNGCFATFNGMQTDWKSHRLTLLMRHYQAQFVSINGKTFGENSRPQNESGVLLSWRHSLSRQTIAEAYVDAMHFPWMKYQVSQSSWGIDAFAQLLHATSHDGQWALRYRIKSKQRDYKLTSDTLLLFNTMQSLRVQYLHRLSPTLSLKSTANMSMVSSAATGNEWGYAFSLYAGWKTRLLRLALSSTLFHTDTYAARVYGYEPSLAYTSGIHSYYYHGVRTVLMARVPLLPQLHVALRLSSTRYFDRSSIGTGLDLIPRNHREDIQLQVQGRF